MFGDFKIIKKCKTTNARVSEFTLKKNTLHLPIFMPVATYGAMRGVKPSSMEEEMILSNTYHLRNLNRNIKDFMGWNKNMLTDSGGFQIQSLPNVEVTDEGVLFDNKLFTPEDSMDIQMGLGADIMMQLDDVVNPKEERELHEKAIERSIEWLDRAIVHINSKNRNKQDNDDNDKDYKQDNDNNDKDYKQDRNKQDNDDNDKYYKQDNDNNDKDYKQDTDNNDKDYKQDNDNNDKDYKTIKNIKNSNVNTVDFDNTFITSSNTIVYNTTSINQISSFKKSKVIPRITPTDSQVLFPIIQGGLLDDLRKKSIDQILQRNPIGLAIGGLSGGEDKTDFCSTVLFCCNNLKVDIPRYLMGVGYPEDIVVCCALGTDMSDCVYPTRTARFGRAFRDSGDLMIDSKVISDLNPIDQDCRCSTCLKFSRSYLSLLKGTPNFCMLMSVHNMFYMRNLTARIRNAILEDKFPLFIKEFMQKRYKENIPGWITKALKKVNVDLN